MTFVDLLCPELTTKGRIVPNGPITEGTVRENIAALLAQLREVPQDCWVYRSVVGALEGYYGTTYATIAGEAVRDADAIHRGAMGDLWAHLPGCPLA